MNYTPALVQMLLTLAGAFGMIVAVLAHFSKNDRQLWRDIAEARQEQIDDLKTQFAAASELGKRERETLSLQIDSLRGEMSLMQRNHEENRRQTDAQIETLMRQNHTLQVKLDKAESMATTARALSESRYQQLAAKQIDSEE